MQERRYERKEGCRKEGVQERKNSRYEGYRKGGIQEMRDAEVCFVKHGISRNEKQFFAKYETRFVRNSRDFRTKETRVSAIPKWRPCGSDFRLISFILLGQHFKTWQLFEGESYKCEISL